MDRAFYLLFPLLFAPLALAAQMRAIAAVDRHKVEAGDTVVVRVQVAGVQAPPQHVRLNDWLSAIPADNLRMRSPWRRSGEYWVQTFSMVLLDTGQLKLPSLSVLPQVGEPIPTNPLEIEVVASPVPADIGAMAPIRDIRRQSDSAHPYWLAAFFSVVLGAAIVAIWLRKRRRASAVPPLPPSEPPLSARDIALQKLDALAHSRPWTTPEQIGRYYAELSWIIREFLAGQYRVAALEQTTREIARHLHQTSLSPAAQAQVEQLLQQADWVKFAYAYPDEEQHEYWLAAARQICQTDTPVVDSSVPSHR